MLVTKPIKFSLVLIKILCVMGSCQKQDNVPPRINVNTPLNNSAFQFHVWFKLKVMLMTINRFQE